MRCALGIGVDWGRLGGNLCRGAWWWEDASCSICRAIMICLEPVLVGLSIIRLYFGGLVGVYFIGLFLVGGYMILTLL